MSPNIINLLDTMHDSRNLSEKKKKKKRKILPTVKYFDLKFCSYPKYANA